MEYNFREIEKKWFEYWKENKTYHVEEDKNKKKFYVLNMFPYPSGAGLHVGHPLGYIASDIYARYKRLQGFNVLNPMGYDAYGLPAEQYAIQTGQHPEVTTNQNINRYREQLDKIGFCFDWDREVRTCAPDYYHWTQWAFQKMYNSYYGSPLPTSPKGGDDTPKARPISEIIEFFKQNGVTDLEQYGVACSAPLGELEGAAWESLDEKQKSDMLMNYRIAFMGETMVNWCAGLGTVLANDEVVDGVSVRGGYPVEQKKMRQWCLRVSAYSQRLLDGLEKIQWSDSIKETQKNWIGRSEGTEVLIKVANAEDVDFTIFTTRADTMFGVTFFVLAPESELVKQLTTAEQQKEVDEYLAYVAKRTERERQIDHTVTGVFSGSYGVNPITGEACPIWISEYVLAGYGTGAIMAVPAHDSRDYAFAKHFNLPIIPLIEGADVSEESYDAKEGIVMNSPAEGKTAFKGFTLNGLTIKEAIAATKKFVSENGLGRVKVNYRLRDAIFSRQRYWGEPFPVYYKNGIPMMIPEECLPIQLPEVEKFLPTETGEPPLGNATKWAWDETNRCVVDCSAIDNVTVFPIELYTMPGFAGSSAYYLRYMDPHNNEALISEDAAEYWQNVDLYVGGSEHATGHLIYSRFWNKFLFDLGISKNDEPFQKLVNQGMIQGRSNFVYRSPETPAAGEGPLFVSYGQLQAYPNCQPIHVDVNIVKNDVLDIEAFRAWRPEYANARFVMEDGSICNPGAATEASYVCGWAVEKMSKSMFNVVNPDMIVEKYGADTLRLYEMFLGPVEQSKPWDTNGIDGCHRFLKKFWGLFYDRQGNWQVTDAAPTAEEEKSLHKLIKKVTQDIENFSYNTSISAFMIAVGELQKCHSKAVLEQLVVLIAPFAPFIAEELWHSLHAANGCDCKSAGSVCDAQWPAFDESKMKDSSITMPVQFCGKTRFTMDIPADASKEDVEKLALADERTPKYMEGKQVVKVIVVPGRIINIVVK